MGKLIALFVLFGDLITGALGAFGEFFGEFFDALGADFMEEEDDFMEGDDNNWML